MNILFYCPFKFGLKSKNIRSLGGIESLNLQLTKYLAKFNDNIYLASFCNRESKIKNLKNIPIKKLIHNISNFKFDKIISSNDPTIFNYSKNSDNFLWLHNQLPLEKAIRKKKFFSILKNKISSIFVSNYLLEKTSNIYGFKQKFVIPNFLDSIFLNIKPKYNRKPYFIWSVQRNKGLNEIITIWKEKIFINHPRCKLFIFGVNKESFNKNHIKTLSKYNIIFKGRVSKNVLKKHYSISMGMICLGYDETFCINAIEAFACGLPIITFGFTAVNELINNKNSFKIISFNDFDKTIYKIYKMPYLKRYSLINYCMNFSTKYSLNNTLYYWKKILKS